jgi:hypothetical protein
MGRWMTSGEATGRSRSSCGHPDVMGHAVSRVMPRDLSGACRGEARAPGPCPQPCAPGRSAPEAEPADLCSTRCPSRIADSRPDSAGRMWIVPPALLPWFWPSAGVRSEAWVPDCLLPPSHRGPVFPHRALDRDSPCHAITLRHCTALTRLAEWLTPAIPQGSSPGRSAGTGTTRATWRSTATPPKTAPESTRQRRMKPAAPRRPAPRRSTSRPCSTGTSSLTFLTGRHRRKLRSRLTGCSAWSSTTEITPPVPPIPQADQPWPLRPIRSRLIAADSRSAPTGVSSGSCSLTISPLSRQPAPTALSDRSTSSTPTSRRQPIRAARSTPSWSR